MPAEFWFEIGCEEIPARAMAKSLGELRDGVKHLLEEERLEFDRVDAFGSARRFVIHAPSLAERQKPRSTLTLGPPARIAYDNGQPSPALVGFARKNNVAVEELKPFSTERGEYFGFETTVEGESAADILTRNLPRIVSSMSFPKTMVWMDPAQRFSRPVRWIIAKHGERLLPLTLFGVRSAGYSEGHRILGAGRVEVGSFADFIEKLRKNYVIVSQEERCRKIVDELDREAARLNARIISDDRLLEEVVFINEYPTVLRGEFDQRFLELPREILITVMKEHQKYFAVETPEGVLAPYFLAVINTAGDPRGLIRKGHERVLRARLTDALFFWEVDRKQSLAERSTRLKSIVFHEKLGSYADKVRRMQKLARKVNALTKARVDSKTLRQAVEWSKSDLTTEMVREFTDLQGVVGGLYARSEGAPEEIWRAIYEHYRPQGLADASPDTPSGAVLSITDKLDTVLGCFNAGVIPTGSEDPLGLRRAMQGVIKVLLDRELPFSMERAAGDGAASQFKQFYEERLRYILEQRGFAYDEINAVVAAGCDDPSDVLDRVKAIREIRSSPDFEAISLAFKRIKNILRQAEKAGERFADAPQGQDLEPAESDLFALLQDIRPRIDKLARRRKYRVVLETMAGARPVIDRFFDKVMVMHENPELRKRRLALLANLFQAFSRAADVSEIVVRGNG